MNEEDKVTEEFDVEIDEIQKKQDLLIVRLIAGRKRKKWSQVDLADRCGVNRNSISKIESFETDTPTLRTFLKYADALGLDVALVEKK